VPPLGDVARRSHVPVRSPVPDPLLDPEPPLELPPELPEPPPLLLLPEPLPEPDPLPLLLPPPPSPPPSCTGALHAASPHEPIPRSHRSLIVHLGPLMPGRDHPDHGFVPDCVLSRTDLTRCASGLSP